MNNTDAIEYTGIIIKVSDVGEYDRRCVILTKEAGKITVFARGAKRMKSQFLAATNPFCYGKFKLLPTKDAYSLLGAEIINYFDSLRMDYDKTILGMYFLEVGDYYSRENNDDYELLKLIYVALLSLTKDKLSNELIKAVFEIKAIVINGEFPGMITSIKVSDTIKYAINRIVELDVTKLFSFDLAEEYIFELKKVANIYCDECIHGNFKTLKLLQNI